MKVEVDVLGSPSLIVLTVSVDVKSNTELAVDPREKNLSTSAPKRPGQKWGEGPDWASKDLLLQQGREPPLTVCLRLESNHSGWEINLRHHPNPPSTPTHPNHPSTPPSPPPTP